jgi:hypothetical protein
MVCIAATVFSSTTIGFYAAVFLVGNLVAY